MKKTILGFLFSAFVSVAALAQFPTSFNYQAVLRDDAGQVITSETLSVEIAILMGSADGTEVFSEVHNTQTNEHGLINLQIGSVSSLADVVWGDDLYFIQVSLDGNIMGTTQLLSVPYALHARTSADSFSGDYDDLNNLPELNYFISLDDPEDGDLVVFHEDGWTKIPLGEEDQVLTIVDGVPAWSDIPESNDGTVTDIDGNVYQTVQIGNQVWMAENLRTTHYADGSPIDGVYTYDSDSENAINYGKLYTWDAVMNGESSSDSNPSGVQGVCPDGWHVPSDAEWTELSDYITGGLQEGGNQLRSCRQINSPLGGDCDTEEHPRWDEHEVQYGTDDYGFGALPGGYRPESGDFFQMGWDAYWWSSTSYTGDRAWRRFIYYDFPNFQRGPIFKTSAFSIRCVKD